MKIIDYFINSNISDVAIIIRCLLDRTPILICGDSDQEVEDFINELNLLINFRTQIIFYTDFVDTNDYINLIENEENDFEIQRSIFICYPFAIEKIIETVPLFNSWILGISNETQLLYTKIKEFLFSKQDYFLNIDLDQKVLKTQIEGKKFPNLKLDFEKTLYQNAINNTEIAIERMRRVISKKIDTKKMPKDLIRNILNFSLEEKDLQINLIKKEITDFYQACKRAFNILNRMKNLETYGLKSQISSKTLYNTVAYEKASIERVLSFIDAEWRSNYSSFLEAKKVSNFADTFESLWG